MKVCKQCHKRNPDDANFCAWCKSQEFESISESSAGLIKTHASKIMIAGIIFILIGIIGVFINTSTPGGSKLVLTIMQMENAWSDKSIHSGSEVFFAFVGTYRYIFLLIGAVLAFIGHSAKKK